MIFPIHRALAVAHILLMCLAAITLPEAASAGDAGEVVIVTSRDDGPYKGVVSGVRGSLSNGDDAESLQVHSLQSGKDAATQALLEARRSGVPVITVGSVATRAALKAPGDSPVVACMIVDSDDLGEDENATGVVLEFPLETQLEWVRKFVPDVRSIGVLYNPAENEGEVANVKKIADRLGLRLVARQVHRPKDLPAALDSVARDADLLFALTDKVVLSRQTAQAILLFSFRNRMPFSGLSASWVKAGALYALERDYEDLGAQCAEMAAKVIKGKAPRSMPPASPRKVTYAVNLKTADHLKISLPPELLEAAAEVFR